MRSIYIVTIILLILALIFAFQNTTSISLKFIAWQFTGSQALIIIIIFFLGLCSGWFLGLSIVWRKNREIRSLKKQVNESSKTTFNPPNPNPSQHTT